MAQILKDMGITEYEPRVINQMLEFAFRKLIKHQKFAYFVNLRLFYCKKIFNWITFNSYHHRIQPKAVKRAQDKEKWYLYWDIFLIDHKDRTIRY